MFNTLFYYVLYAAIGFSSSFFIISLKNLHVDSVWPYLLIAAFTFVFSLAFDKKHILKLLLSSFITALIITFPFFTFSALNPTSAHYINDYFLEFALTFPYFAFVIYCFHYAYHKSNKLDIDYHYLFEAVWLLFPIFFIAGFFSNAVNALILFAAYGFNTFGNRFLLDVYVHNIDVFIIANTTFFFIGLAIAKLHEKAAINLRYLILRMFQLLLPILMISMIIYSLMFITFHGWHMFTLSSIMGSSTFVAFGILGVLFFNASYQDGEEEQTHSKIIHRIYEYFRVILFLVTSYGITQLIYSNYHRMPINISLLLACMILYTFCYALSTFFPKDKQKRIITQGNILITLAYIIITLCFYNPLTNHQAPKSLFKDKVSIQEMIKINEAKHQ